MTTENLPICPATGKTGYPNRDHVRQAVVSLKKNKNTPNASSYQCPHCGLWHMTSNKPKGQYKRRQKRKNKKGDFK